MFESKVLRKIFGPVTEEVRGNYRELFWKPQPHFNGHCPLSAIPAYLKETTHLVLAVFLSSAYPSYYATFSYTLI